jgi:hypothetical protein
VRTEAALGTLRWIVSAPDFVFMIFGALWLQRGLLLHGLRSVPGQFVTIHCLKARWRFEASHALIAGLNTRSDRC